jgi:hypothetical protein
MGRRGQCGMREVEHGIFNLFTERLSSLIGKEDLRNWPKRDGDREIAIFIFLGKVMNNRG